MPDCTDRNEQVMLDVYGELDAGARSALEDHLSTCADCRREKENLTAMLGQVRQAMVPPPLSMQDSAAIVRKVQDRLAVFRLPGGRRQPVKEKRVLWIPALAAACVLVVVAIFVGYERSGNIAQPVAQRLDISQKLPENEEEIVKNLDLLKNFNTLEKLSQVVDDSAGRNPSETHNQGTQGDIRYGHDERSA
ncbi:MAG: zf-HC2 domain-containing protein [Desulfobacterales bacterium]